MKAAGAQCTPLGAGLAGLGLWGDAELGTRAGQGNGSRGGKDRAPGAVRP